MRVGHDKDYISTNLQILSFDAEELKTKTEFLNFHQKYIAILPGTSKADTSKLNLPDFWDYSQVRPKQNCFCQTSN